MRVRPGFRKRGIAHRLIAGAVAAYPVDNDSAKVDLTMAYVGTRAMFEQAGFEKVADTTSVLNGFPPIVMRLSLS